MRGRHGTADAVEAAKNQVPLIICKPNRLMDKGRNGARYFRNPPQPHMCIQDYIEDTNEPCFINVLSWIKISTPRKPEDPIPLYGGMRVPHNSSTALSLSSHFGAKGQPVIFAVMANPEILRLSGKTAEDPSDRDALVELMIDFVEAMNPDVRFKRHFTVLRDRDLAGELKDIWLAVQAKRERERGENGKKESEKGRENKEDSWRDEVRHRQAQNVSQEQEISSIQSQETIEVSASNEEVTVSERNESIYRAENPKIGAVEEQYQAAGQISSQCIYRSSQTTTTLHSSASPSSPEPMKTNSQRIGSLSCQEESVYSIIRSHYEQDLNLTESNTLSSLHKSALPLEQGPPEVLTSICVPKTPQLPENVCSLFPACMTNDSLSSFEATSAIQPIDERNIILKSVEHDQIHCTSSRPKDDKCNYKADDKNVFNNECPSSCSTHFSYESISHMKEETQGKPNLNSNLISPKHSSTPAEEHSFSGYTSETMFLNTKSQVSNTAGRSHEDLLPGLCDSPGAKFPIVSDHNTVAIP